MRKVLFIGAAAMLGMGGATAAIAGEAQVHLVAYVPTTCEMHFNRQVAAVSGSAYSLGTVDQFCNTPYELTLMHASAPAGAQLQLGDKIVPASGTSTMIESHGRPVNGSAQLLAYNVGAADAAALGSTMTFVVTPTSF